MATILLRLGATGATGVKNSPLTNAEIDTNFSNLNTDIGTRLLSSDYTAADVLTKIKTVDGTGSGLDADLLDGLNAVSGATGASIVSRDASGNFSAGTITATLSGNVTGNFTGNVTGNVAGNLTGDVYASDGTTKILENSTGATGAPATFTGNVTGNVTGDVTGNTTGNHNGAIGNATPSTGAFTTLSASGTLSVGAAAVLGGTLSANGSNGTSGQYLKSRGSSSNPIWDTVSVSLLTQVTDTLPAGNGGTGLASPGTAGNVLLSNGTSWDSQPISITVTELSGDPTGSFPTDEQTGSAPIFAARAWANFDGTKDTTNATSTSNTNRLIKASGNVTSILRNSIGNYTLTFRTALPNANYAAVATGFLSSGNAAIITTDASTTSTVTINCVDASNAEADFSRVNIVIFG
jgi:trimeric autotransporter adhesin